MFCIASFVVLSILGIFSASNRALAREALDCVLRRVTFRPCNTGFDQKMKAKLLGVVITRSEGAARFLNKYFEAIAWVFIVLMLAATFMFGRGLYFFYTNGNCNGPQQQDAFCIFDPTGANTQVSGAPTCSVDALNGTAKLSAEGLTLQDFPASNPGAEKEIIFIGSYHCEYTREVYSSVRQLAEKFDANLIFLDYPINEANDNLARLGYCVNQQDPEKFWQMNDILFATPMVEIDQPGFTDQMLTDLGLNPAVIKGCVSDVQTETIVESQLKQIVDTKFYGTPTVFINGEGLVGPKPTRVYAIQLEGFFWFLKK